MPEFHEMLPANLRMFLDTLVRAKTQELGQLIMTRYDRDCAFRGTTTGIQGLADLNAVSQAFKDADGKTRLGPELEKVVAQIVAKFDANRHARVRTRCESSADGNASTRVDDNGAIESVMMPVDIYAEHFLVLAQARITNVFRVELPLWKFLATYAMCHKELSKLGANAKIKNLPESVVATAIKEANTQFKFYEKQLLAEVSKPMENMEIDEVIFPKFRLGTPAEMAILAEKEKGGRGNGKKR